MRGKGVKPVRSGVTGDLLCRVMVETPVKLNARQKELLREFEESIEHNSKHHNPQNASWMDRVKQFFDELKA
jgi:molecular chaperone DnaJ